MTLSHVTVEMCISASGQIIPPMVIFESSLPLLTAQDEWPTTWTYAVSDNGETLPKNIVTLCVIG